MTVLETETIAVRSEQGLMQARQAVKAHALALRFSLVEQTKMVTAASELGRNTLVHGGGGSMTLEVIEDGRRRGLRLVFEDAGPGIAEIEQALKDGYTTAGGMGLGLGGSKRLVNEFEISSRVGEGTRVSVVRWK